MAGSIDRYEVLRAARSLVVVAPAILAACATDGSVHQPLVMAPLEGRIYQVATGRFVERDELIAALVRADFALLGERHDNAEHHRRQAELVRALQDAAPGPRPVAFETIPAERQIDIVTYRKEHPDDAAGLGAALGWRRNGRPDWERDYAPIAQAALDAGAEIVGADLSAAQTDAIRRRGPEALRTAFLRRTGLDRDLPRPLFTALEDQIRDAHCGAVPEEALGGMVQVQRARDAMLADRLAAVAGRSGAILIAGTEHVRRDRGVPLYLAHLRPRARVVSLAFVEVDATSPSTNLPYDFLWLTGPVERGDPCVEHREQLRRMVPGAEPRGS